jgi:Zn-dependent metalloprotease
MNLNVPDVKLLSEKEFSAYWDGKAFYASPQVRYIPDITYWNMVHQFTDRVADLEYQGQSGAIKQSYAYIFASLVKQKLAGKSAKDADWVLAPLGLALLKGEDLANPKDKSPLFSLKEPGTAYGEDEVLGKDLQVGHVSKLYKGSDDLGGVHWNAGIPDKAFYETSIRIETDVASKIWVEALKKLSPAKRKDLKTLAAMTLDAAKQIYGKDGKEEAAVKAAWKEVGISL